MENKKNLLISIHKKFLTRIFSGEKKVEFRKKWVANSTEKVFFYETSPTKKIVGYAIVSQVVHASPKELWEKFGQSRGGVTEAEFFEYFGIRPEGYAVVFSVVVQFETMIEPSQIFAKFTAPQSVMYLSTAEVEKLLICNNVMLK